MFRFVARFVSQRNDVSRHVHVYVYRMSLKGVIRTSQACVVLTKLNKKLLTREPSEVSLDFDGLWICRRAAENIYSHTIERQTHSHTVFRQT